MKKFLVFSSMFLIVFGLTVGLTIGLGERAQALYECADQCLGTLVCSTDTGPLCPSAHNCGIYYVYLVPTCSGGPRHCPGPGTYTWSGCTDAPGTPCEPCLEIE